MKRRDRELNIFSMSALDLFASALGAFILITLVLMPYYKKQTPSPEQQQPQSCPEIPAPPVCPVCPTPRPAPECPTPTTVEVPVIVDKMLLIEMKWANKNDIDLHVITPDGEFYYNRKLIEGKPGQFLIDDTNGGSRSSPAKEIWLTFAPTPGNYKICYHYYAGNDGVTRIQGKIHKPSGPINLPSVRLNRKGDKECPLRFSMDSDFNFTQL